MKPHLDYCSFVWNPPLVKDQEALESVQKFALRPHYELSCFTFICSPCKNWLLLFFFCIYIVPVSCGTLYHLLFCSYVLVPLLNTNLKIFCNFLSFIFAHSGSVLVLALVLFDMSCIYTFLYRSHKEKTTTKTCGTRRRETSKLYTACFSGFHPKAIHSFLSCTMKYVYCSGMSPDPYTCYTSRTRYAPYVIYQLILKLGPPDYLMITS